MGVLQALEAIKVLTAKPPPTRDDDWFMDLTADAAGTEEPVRPTLLMFSAYSSPQFRSVRLRSRRSDCAACSCKATTTRQALESGSLDYVAFCGVSTPLNMLPASARVTAAEFSRLPRDGSNILIDVRDETQYAICALRGSINVPWTGNSDSWYNDAVAKGAISPREDGRNRYIVCRLGNDSQLAVKAALDAGGGSATLKDIKGGFRAWKEEVDPGWPEY